MMNTLEKLINEDLVNHSQNQGYNGNNMIYQRPSQMSLVDILKADKGEWEKAKKVLPYQLGTVMDQVIHQYDATTDLKNKFVIALKNPIVSDDEQSKEIIKKIMDELDKVNIALNNVGSEIQKMTI